MVPEEIKKVCFWVPHDETDVSLACRGIRALARSTGNAISQVLILTRRKH